MLACVKRATFSCLQLREADRAHVRFRHEVHAPPGSCEVVRARWSVRGGGTAVSCSYCNARCGVAFGKAPGRNCRVCAIGFEPNPRHAAHLEVLQATHNAAGVGVLVIKAAATTVDSGSLTFFTQARRAGARRASARPLREMI